jgi:hypothetical protein
LFNQAGVMHRWPPFRVLWLRFSRRHCSPQAARGGLHASESVIPAGAMSVKSREISGVEESAR